MKQFIDHFTALQQWDAGAYIALGAVATFISLGVYAVCRLISDFWEGCQICDDLEDE